MEKKSLDNKNIIGASLMDLPKAFGCIPLNLLVTQLHVYGLTIDAVTFVYSYLIIKINDKESLCRITLSCVPQGSILGLILVNTFWNDLFLLVTEAKLANFVDDNTIYAVHKDIEKLLLEEESEAAINWFSVNDMIDTPRKFQVMVAGGGEGIKDNYTLEINDRYIATKSSVTLLGVETDKNLIFNSHILTICQ